MCVLYHTEWYGIFEVLIISTEDGIGPAKYKYDDFESADFLKLCYVYEYIF